MRSRIFISSVQKEFAEERKLLVADVLAAKHSVPKGPSWGLSRGPSRGAVRAQPTAISPNGEGTVSG